jgi:hypothetical protein
MANGEKFMSNRQATARPWSDEWPAENGFYWTRDREDETPILVEVHRNRLTICGGNGRNVKEAFEASWFRGPITPDDFDERDALLVERDRLREALHGLIHSAEFALSTPGFIRGRDELKKSVHGAITLSGKEGE